MGDLSEPGRHHGDVLVGLHVGAVGHAVLPLRVVPAAAAGVHLRDGLPLEQGGSHAVLAAKVLPAQLLAPGATVFT